MGVVSAFSIRIMDCEKPVLKRNGLSVLGEYKNATRNTKTFFLWSLPQGFIRDGLAVGGDPSAERASGILGIWDVS